MTTAPMEAMPAPEGEAVSGTSPEVRLVRKHPLAIRWNHWINFPVLFVMVWSGFLILWAHDAYPNEPLALKVPNRISFYRGPSAPAAQTESEPGIRFPVNLRLPGGGVAVVYGDRDTAEYPAPVERRWDIRTGFRLSEGMAWHFTFAWLFTLNGVAYTVFLLVSGQWRHLVPLRNSLTEAWKVVLHDVGLYRKPLPPGKYNHAQRIAYTGVWAMGVGMVVTGLAIYKPAQMNWLADLLGGYQAARTEHFLLTMLFLAFFVIHIAQVMRAGWQNFQGMITGYELQKRSETANERL